jgi:hypothetical protein
VRTLDDLVLLITVHINNFLANLAPRRHSSTREGATRNLMTDGAQMGDRTQAIHAFERRGQGAGCPAGSATSKETIAVLSVRALPSG